MIKVRDERARGIIRVISILAGLFAGAALVIFAASLLTPYDALRRQLVHSYGEDRTGRYFSPARFASLLVSARLLAGFLALFGLAIWSLRGRLVLFLQPSASALALSFRHLRRHRFGPDPFVTVAIALLVSIGLFTRLQFIHQPMRDDESTTMMLYASKPFYIGLSVYIEPNNHLLHTLLVHSAVSVAGAAEWVIRLPALLAGLLLIPLTYALVSRFSSRTAAIWAAALVTSSSILIEYSTNARGYTLLGCATAILLIAADGALKRASPRWFAVFGIACVLGCWTVPIFLIPMGGAVIWLVWEAAHRHRRFRRIFLTRLALTCVLGGAATVLVYVPPVFVSGFKSVFKNDWIAPRDFQTFLSGNFVRFQRTWISWNRDLPTWWGPALAILFLVSLALYPRLRALWVSLALWTVFLFLARRFVPFERTWLFFLPLFLGTAASAPAWLFDRLPRTRLRFAAAAGTAVLLAALLAVPIIRNRSILESGETGVLKSASHIVDYLRSRDLSPSLVLRNRDYDFPLQYYYWRQNGADAPQADLRSVQTRNGGEVWLLVNTDIGESFEADVQKFGLRGVRILEIHPFDGSALYRVAWSQTSPQSAVGIAG